MNDNMARHRQEIESLRTEAYNQKGLAQKWEAEVQRLTKEGADFRNEAEDADLSLACIADQLGIKGSIKDWLQSIGGAIRELKTEVERLSKEKKLDRETIDIHVAQCMRLRSEVENLTDAVVRWTGIANGYESDIELLNSKLETMKSELASWIDKATEFGLRAESAERETIFVRRNFDDYKQSMADFAVADEERQEEERQDRAEQERRRQQNWEEDQMMAEAERQAQEQAEAEQAIEPQEDSPIEPV